MNNPPHELSGRIRRRRGLGARLAVAGLGLALAACASTADAKLHLGGIHLGPFGKHAGKGVDYRRWDAYLGAQSSQFSSFDQINTSNVGKLAVAWTYETGAGSPDHFQPLVVDGVMYIMAHGNTLVALDPATGKELWRKAYEGRSSSRGMNYWQSADGKDRRLLFLNNGMLTAVSAANGDPIPSFGQGGKVDLRVGLEGDISKIRALQTDNPGQVFRDLIILSLPAGAYDFASPPAGRG